MDAGASQGALVELEQMEAGQLERLEREKGMVMRFDSESAFSNCAIGGFSGVWHMNEGELRVLAEVHLQCWDRGGVRGFCLSACSVLAR